MKLLITAVIAAVITGAVMLSIPGFRRGAGSPDEKPAVVRLQEVQGGDLTEFVTAPGQVEPKTRVSISARVAARITALPCAEGARVTKGDDAGVSPTLLVKLDATDLEAALRSAKARRAAQEASIEVERERIAAQKANLR
ncbi:MAG: biotin/lipoyl-binding protein, partial [Phycisphaerae bacterium]|nr:biotin/lipoyl-binding protein [Phycisphaerae bacterium]